MNGFKKFINGKSFEINKFELLGYEIQLIYPQCLTNFILRKFFQIFFSHEIKLLDNI